MVLALMKYPVFYPVRFNYRKVNGFQQINLKFAEKLPHMMDISLTESSELLKNL